MKNPHGSRRITERIALPLSFFQSRHETRLNQEFIASGLSKSHPVSLEISLQRFIKRDCLPGGIRTAMLVLSADRDGHGFRESRRHTMWSEKLAMAQPSMVHRSGVHSRFYAAYPPSRNPHRQRDGHPHLSARSIRNPMVSGLPCFKPRRVPPLRPFLFWKKTPGLKPCDSRGKNSLRTVAVCCALMNTLAKLPPQPAQRPCGPLRSS